MSAPADRRAPGGGAARPPAPAPPPGARLSAGRPLAGPADAAPGSVRRGDAGIRLATWNVAWMTALFDAQGALLADDGRGGLPGVRRADQIAGVAIALAAMDPDAVLVVEAPDDRPAGRTVAALERFAATFALRCRRAAIGFPSATEQEIAVLHDPDALALRHVPRGAPTGRKGAPGAPRFDGVLRIAGTGGPPDLVRFSKPPLELEVRPASGAPFRLIGVHLKSKAPHGARGPGDVARHALAARRLQRAQAVWLRRRVEALLAAGEALVVMGDLNDGPGLDPWEARLGGSSVEIVAGLGGPAWARLHDPALGPGAAGPGATARFRLGPEGRTLDALLDFAMVSPDLLARGPSWRIWHPERDPAIAAVPDLRVALREASDHYPVTLDFAP